MRNFILCDIDHVISNSYPRDPMIGGEGGWDAYHAASENDAPLEDVKTLINAMSDAGFRIICITARPSKWRQLTMRWMAKHGIDIHELLMRDDNNFRPSPEMKMELALARFGSEQDIRDNVVMLLEDRDDVATAFRGIGITVLQVFARRD